MDDKLSKTAKNIAVAAGVGLGAATVSIVGSYFLTKYLVSIALDKKQPKIAERADKIIAGSKRIDHRFLEELKEESEKLAARENETVEIEAIDGEKLIGHLFEHEGDERIIIAMHGWRGSWHNDFGTVMSFWESNNCTVLYPEQRGQSNSGGDYIGFGLTERFDAQFWARWAAERFGSEKPIYLCGVSMGAATVLMASDLDLPSNVRGIIADCGFTSPGAIWKHVANNNLHIMYGLPSMFADQMFKQRNLIGINEHSTIDSLKATKIPVLFIHGTDDHFVPVRMTYDNYRACASPKRLLIVPGADHGMSHYTEPEKYENTIKEFFRDFDNYSPSEEPKDH